MAAVPGRLPGSQGPVAGACLGGAAAGRRLGGLDDDAQPRLVQRQGPARAGLDPGLPQLADGLPLLARPARPGRLVGEGRLAVAAEDLDLDGLRPLMFSIAYRMTGSVGDAEDIVQEAVIRTYRAAGQGAIESPKAFVTTTTTTRLAIDHLRSARVQREAYVGTGLREPLLSEPDPGPAERAEMSDSLSMAFLVLLESLSPVE